MLKMHVNLIIWKSSCLMFSRTIVTEEGNLFYFFASWWVLWYTYPLSFPIFTEGNDFMLLVANKITCRNAKEKIPFNNSSFIKCLVKQVWPKPSHCVQSFSLHIHHSFIIKGTKFIQQRQITLLKKKFPLCY